MAKLRVGTKGVLCLESMWDRRARGSRLSVLPLLELLEKTVGVPYIYLSCNTKSELKYGLSLARRYSSFGVLYLAFHGSPGAISLPGEPMDVALEEVGQMAPTLEKWMIHMSSCETISEKSAVGDLLSASGAALASGYQRSVDWIDSAAMDLLLLAAVQDYSLSLSLERRIRTSYASLADSSGLFMVHS